MAPRLVCHHCGRPHGAQYGGDLTCGPDCQERFEKARSAAEETLSKAGFVQNVDIPNLWLKDGVHISIDQVIREGLEETLAQHRAATR